MATDVTYTHTETGAACNACLCQISTCAKSPETAAVADDSRLQGVFSRKDERVMPDAHGRRSMQRE